jgi:serine O-acetyltransferase
MPSADLSFRELVFSDLARYRSDPKPSWFKVLRRCLTVPGMIASLIVRGQQCLYRAGRVGPANVLRVVGTVLVGAEFGPGMEIGTGLMIAHPVGVGIGYGVKIGDNVTLANGVVAAARNYQSDEDQAYATICDDAIIGAHAVLVGEVRIGVRAMVGANSVVITDVPDGAIVIGSPARQIGVR